MLSTAARSRQCISRARDLRNVSTSTGLAAASQSKRSVTRLFLAGTNPFLPPTQRGAKSPLFTEVPFTEWIGSIGISNDPKEVEITHIAAGHRHAMIAYRYQGVESIFAIGRNDSGQLGIGYNSHEPTRGLVEGFKGDFVESISCGITSSMIKVKQGGKAIPVKTNLSIPLKPLLRKMGRQSFPAET